MTCVESQREARARRDRAASECSKRITHKTGTTAGTTPRSTAPLRSRSSGTAGAVCRAERGAQQGRQRRRRNVCLRCRRSRRAPASKAAAAAAAAAHLGCKRLARPPLRGEARRRRARAWRRKRRASELPRRAQQRRSATHALHDERELRFRRANDSESGGAARVPRQQVPPRLSSEAVSACNSLRKRRHACVPRQAGVLAKRVALHTCHRINAPALPKHPRHRAPRHSTAEYP
jgi:hypothetical protein